MKTSADAAFEPFLRRLTAHGRSLSSDEVEALQGAMSDIVTYPAGHDFVHEGEYRDVSNLLIDGWAARYNGLRDGSRQFLAMHVSGDFVDLHSFQLKVMDHSVYTLTPCTIGLFPHAGLYRLTEKFPNLTRQLWMLTVVDAAIMRQWMLGLGQRKATEHAAHLFCELYHRLTAVGLTAQGGYRLPLTQTELGAALGISAVHTNRTLQALRRRDLIVLRGEDIGIPDLARLEAFCAFDPIYLHIPALMRTRR